MSSDVSSKIQNALWWITSIATAVVCCSIIFVLFASYFVDVREDIREGNLRINSIEEREDRILAEIEMIRKHGVGPMTQPASEAPAAPASAAPAPAPAVDTTPTPLAPAAPATEAPAVAPTPNSQATPPAAPVPSVAAPSTAPSPETK